MICGHISNYNALPLPRALLKALDFLRYTDLKNYEPGEYEIDGRRIYAQVIDMQTKPTLECPIESHRRYIDIQYLCSGDSERIGFEEDLGQLDIEVSKLPQRDIIFYQGGALASSLRLTEGSFAIFFANDLHQPGIADGISCTIRKVVVKVDMNLLWDQKYE